MERAPSDYTSAGTFMLIGAIFTAIASCIWILYLIWVCVGAFWFLALGVAIWALVDGVRMASGTRVEHAKITCICALVAAVLCCNLIGIIMQVLALTNVMKPEVEAYMLGGDPPA